MHDGIARQVVLDCLTSRRSVRGFRTDAVPRETIEQILHAAARAPSATNTQPWHVHVLTGAAKSRLTASIISARAGGADEPLPEYPYYPATMPEPYLSRRRAIGWNLYGQLGIAKGDHAAARAWHDQNFHFFSAPVGMIFTLDRRLGLGAYLDLGMFMQNIMTAARAFDLDTCPQAAFAGYHTIIRHHLGLPDEELVLCGMALGHADTQAIANQIRSDREPVANFTVFSE